MKGIKKVAGESKELKNGGFAVIVYNTENDTMRLEGPYLYNEQYLIEQIAQELAPYECGYIIREPMKMVDIYYMLNAGSPTL